MLESKKRPGEKPRIESLYVAVAAKDGDEGVIAKQTPLGWLPLVFSAPARMDTFVAMLQGIAEEGETVEIVEFQRVGTVRRIG